MKFSVVGSTSFSTLLSNQDVTSVLFIELPGPAVNYSIPVFLNSAIIWLNMLQNLLEEMYLFFHYVLRNY